MQCLVMLACVIVAFAAVCSAKKGNEPPAPPHGTDLSVYKNEKKAEGGLGLRHGTCLDRHRYCGYWAFRGFCHNSYYTSYMRTSCRNSCNFCDVTPPYPGGGIYNQGGQNGGHHGQNNGYNGNSNGYNGQNSGYNGHNSGYNGHNSGYNGQNSGYNGQNSGYNGQNSGYNGHNSGYNSGFNNAYNNRYTNGQYHG